MKNKKWTFVLRAVVYLLIFAVLFTLASFLFIPKRSGAGENSQIAGFYKEPKNTIDVLGLGSCNLYSSFSPVVLYEKYGITCYNFCCPDEELSTSYYFLKDALKTQDIKVVMVESLFFLAENTQKREYYNRLAMDYMPISFNKLGFMAELSKQESEWMKQYDPTTPDTLLTFAGYLFPILRYHSRNDLGRNDLKKLFKPGEYSYYKGGVPQYTYTRNDGNFFNTVFNGDKLTDAATEYIPKIKQLCDEKNIRMFVVKSPNYLRWGTDDAHTKLVRDYCDELGIPFVDFHLPEYNNFEIWDYGDHTGRLNVYGMRKFSETVGSYLTGKMGLEPSELSDKDRAAWDKCVEKYYETAAKKGCDIYQGHIAQLKSLDGALEVRWNVCDDCDDFGVYRKAESGEFELLAESVRGETYEDTDVVSGKGYTYYVVPNEGVMKGKASPEAYAVYLDMPADLTVENENGSVRLTWTPVPEAKRYVLQRRIGAGFAFEDLAEVRDSSYVDDSAEEGSVYYYRLLAVCEENGKEYTSMSEIGSALPRSTPEITGIKTDGGVTIRWAKLGSLNSIRVYRRAGNETEFSQIAVLDGSATSFTDKDTEIGVEYFYRIAAFDSYLDFTFLSEFSNTVSATVRY